MDKTEEISDAVKQNGLNDEKSNGEEEEKTEIQEGLSGAAQDSGASDEDSDGTGPDKPDAIEQARIAYKYREEKRRRKALEQELAEAKARLSVNVKEKPVLPQYDDFDDIAEYNKAMAEYHEKLTDWKLEQREALQSAKAAEEQFFSTIQNLEREYEAQAEEMAKKYHDYYDKVEKALYTPAMHEAIFKSDNKAAIAYYIASNPEINEKLLKASPVDVALEISRLDIKFKSANKQKNTKLPPPIDPVSGNDVAGKDISKMTAQEYYEAKKAGIIK